MRSLETITMSILLFPEGNISAFGDHNLEIRIGFQGLNQSGPMPEVGLGTGPAQSATAPPTCLGQVTLSAPALPCGPSPLPHVHLPAHIYFSCLPFLEEWWWVAVTSCMAGGFGCVPSPLYGLH
jgi:hypothetical protein